MALGQKVCSFSVQTTKEKSYTGLIHNQVILSDKADKIREIILKKKFKHFLLTPSFDEPTARFFSHYFFCTFFVRVHLPTERHVCWTNIFYSSNNRYFIEMYRDG